MSAKVLTALLVVALAAPASLVHAGGADTAQTGTRGIQASADRAVQAAVLQSAHTSTFAQATIPRTLPRTGKVSKQSTGGGSTAMIIGLAGTAAGLVGTYYVVKMVQDETKNVQSTAAGLR